MRNVIFADVRTGATRGTHFCSSAATRGGGLIRGWIVGTTEPLFRGKERGIFEIKRLTARREAVRRSNRRRNLHTKCIYVYGMYALVNALRENSVALSPSNETFNNFPRRKTEGDGTYLRYYVENIQRDEILREEESCPRYPGLTIRCWALENIKQFTKIKAILYLYFNCTLCVHLCILTIQDSRINFNQAFSRTLGESES